MALNDQERKRAEEIKIAQLQEKYNTRELENHFKDLEKGKDEDEAKFYFENWELILSILNPNWKKRKKDELAKEILQDRGEDCEKIEKDFFKMKDKILWVKTASFTRLENPVYWSEWNEVDYRQTGKNSYLFLICSHKSTVIIIPPSTHNRWFTQNAIKKRKNKRDYFDTRIYTLKDEFELENYGSRSKENINHYINNYVLIGLPKNALYATNIIIKSHFLAKNFYRCLEKES